MKIKIKLTNSEFKAFYDVLSELVPAVRRSADEQERQLRLKNLAMREILTSLYLKMTVKIDNIEQQKEIRFSLKMYEAWALYLAINGIIDLLDDYAMAICLKITGEINRRSV